jgi:hypothetical protein
VFLLLDEMNKIFDFNKRSFARKDIISAKGHSQQRKMLDLHLF